MGNFAEEIIEQPDDPLGGASGDKRLFNLKCLGKTNNPRFPFSIANEVIATQIGQALGLNIPSVLTHRTASGEEWALIEWQHKVPKAAIEIRRYVDDHPQDVHAAIVFDLFIANNDRAFGPERRNLAFDEEGRLLLYDQGNACFYRNRPTAKIEAGIPRLRAVEADLTAMNDMAEKRNVYFQLLDDWQLVDEWCKRIRSLPDFVFQAAVDRVPLSFSRPTVEERSRLVEWFVRRKERLFDSIFRSRSVMFPKLPEFAARRKA